MMSLFSSFDSFYFMVSMVFMMTFFPMLFNFTFKSNSPLYFFKTMNFYLEKFFFSMKPSFFNKFFSYFCIMSMAAFFVFNLTGVWPYNFAFTSQMSLILFISFLIWMSMIGFSLAKNLKGFLSHLIPEGTPIYLTWFLFFIEIISNCIRPLTLTIRLMANILAGHLLMILLFKMVSNQYLYFSLYILLNSVELFVSMIQSYIFFTMICLYYSEA